MSERASNGRSSSALASLSWKVRLAACGLLVLFVVQASVASRRDSVTIDEFVHLPVGLHALYTGDFRQDPINPPWSRMIAALPLLSRPPAFSPDPGTPHWGMGYHLMQRNAAAYQDIFVRARAAIIALGALLGMLVFAWSVELYGWRAGLAALFLYSFSPNVLAHSHLVTLDLSGTFGFTASAYATWRLLERPGITRAALVGAALAVSTLLKLSGFVLIAVVVTLVAVRAFGERRRRDDYTPVQWLGLLSVAGVTSIFVLNLGYVFDGTFAPLSGATLDPKGMLAGWAERWPWLRLPFPRPFINGVDMVLNVGKVQEPSYFLAGELSSDGWWYYHLAAFALKTPLPIVALSLVATLAWLARSSPGHRDYCVFVPVLMIFASNTLFNSLQIGVRHVLPAYPLLFIAAGPWIDRALRRRARSGLEYLAPSAAAVALVWTAVASVAVAPRYLQYFNVVAGGPQGGHRMLIDSNIDWGQDLIRLSEYIDREELDGIFLAYFGRVDPRVYGVRFAPLERNSSGGKAAISASFLMGRPYFWYLGGRMRWVNANTYAWLREHEPVARVGSMFIYDLP